MNVSFTNNYPHLLFSSSYIHQIASLMIIPSFAICNFMLIVIWKSFSRPFLYSKYLTGRFRQGHKYIRANNKVRLQPFSLSPPSPFSSSSSSIVIVISHRRRRHRRRHRHRHRHIYTHTHTHTHILPHLNSLSHPLHLSFPVIRWGLFGGRTPIATVRQGDDIVPSKAPFKAFDEGDGITETSKKGLALGVETIVEVGVGIGIGGLEPTGAEVKERERETRVETGEETVDRNRDDCGNIRGDNGGSDCGVAEEKELSIDDLW